MPKPSYRRVHFMDELRGFLILWVVVYHLLYDLAVIFSTGINFILTPAVDLVRNIGTGTLIFISGICCLYSRSNFRRGMQVFLCALGLTLATYFVIPTQLIVFGILHFFGAAMMLYALLAPLLRKIPTLPGLLVFFLLFFLSFSTYSGYLSLFGFWKIPLPAFLYNHPLLFPLGFACEGMFSADYYPLIPWIFLFFAGSLFGRYLQQNRLPEFFYTSHCPWLARVGQKTLLIYLIHQPILYGVLLLIFSLMNRE